MADVVKTCANCGNVQTAGEFCEKCGTRMPAMATPVAPPPPPAAAPSAVPGAAATAAGAVAAGAAATGAAYTASQYGAPPGQGAPQYTAAAGGQAPPQYGAGPAYGAGPSGPGGPRYDYRQKKGFFGRLFDFSFEEFITPSIIKILFIISIVVVGLGVLGGIIAGFMVGAASGVFFLIGGLIGGFLTILYVRVLLELFIVFFRIHDNTEDIAKNKR